MRGESEREDRVREHFLFIARARRGGRLLFESTLGADDFVLQCTGCCSKHARAQTYNKYTPCKWYTSWVETCSLVALRRKYHSNNPVVSSSLRIRAQFRTHFGFKQMNLSTSIAFKLALLDSAFHLGFETTWSGIYLSFEHLVKDYDIKRKHYFRHLQIRDFTPKHVPSFPAAPSGRCLEDFFSLNLHRQGCISELNDMIQNISGASLNHPKCAWKEELEIKYWIRPDNPWLREYTTPPPVCETRCPTI